MSSNFSSDFSKLDINNDNSISLEELEIALVQKKIPVSRSVLLSFFNSIDTDRDGQISEDEFKLFCDQRELELRRVFDSVDKDRNGSLDSQEVKLSIQKIGMQVSEKQLEAVMRRLTTTSTNTSPSPSAVSFDQFKQALLILPSVNPSAVFESWRDIDDTIDVSTSGLGRSAKTEVGQSLLQSILSQLYAGGVAGCVSRTATAPLERFKMIVQARAPGSSSHSGGMALEFRKLYSEGGVRSFFKGNGINCVKIAPETATKFFLFEHFKKVLSSGNGNGNGGNVTVGEKFIAGGGAGCGSQLLVYPLEILKTRFTVAAVGTYTSYGDCLAKLFRSEGVRGLYKGCGASTIGIIPYAGTDLMINSLIR